MILQLRELFQTEGLRVPVEGTIALEELADLHGYTFAEPVQMHGELHNRAGIVTLHAVCDRCLAPIHRQYSYDFSHVVVPSLRSEGEVYDTYLVADQDRIDMNETAISDLLLMLPTKMLCREDCKGLCYICGCDLNESTCDCQK